MTNQEYTNEEKAFKADLEALAQQIEPDANFVNMLETQLMQSEALASTKEIKPTVIEPPKSSFWNLFNRLNWGITGALVVAALIAIVFVGGLGYALFATTTYRTPGGDTVSQLPEPTQVGGYPATWTPTASSPSDLNAGEEVSVAGDTEVDQQAEPPVREEGYFSPSTSEPTNQQELQSVAPTPLPQPTLLATAPLPPTMTPAPIALLTDEQSETTLGEEDRARLQNSDADDLAEAPAPASAQESIAEVAGGETVDAEAPAPAMAQESAAAAVSGDTADADGEGLSLHPPATPIPLPTATPTPTLSPPTPEGFFQDYTDNPFVDTIEERLSTFAMDIDTASYTLARNYLMQLEQLPPPEAIRYEEFINYFDANYDSPTEVGEAFALHLDAAPAPFGADGHQLFRVGIQGRTVPREERDPALLIFVIDVSGSMEQQNRLGLVKESLAVLVEEMTERDRIGIVVYSDNSRVVLLPTPASEKATILDAINALHTEGSTNVDAGLQLGYQLAEGYQNFDETTRVIVLSDGVANVDVVTPDGILSNIQQGVERGVTLSTIGFGMGDYNDHLMEQLANDGNGNYYYVDNLRQARRVFVHDLTGTLQVIGYDAKVQVDFNPAITQRYRLIGYENRALAAEDFRDNSVDAGEVGAGHNVTALYEIALTGRDLSPSDVIATAFIRYQDAETREFVELSEAITVGELYPSIAAAPQNFRLHAAAAEFAELLGQGYWAREGSYRALDEFVRPLEIELFDSQQVSEFAELVRRARGYVGE
ncbi:MAG: von Willebrand factor type A domain-containing protein [Chloroflexota bacterium]